MSIVPSLASEGRFSSYLGRSKYDALNMALEKRMSNFWSGRVAYTLSDARGNYSGGTVKLPRKARDRPSMSGFHH